jgi:hypothetical protein
VFTRHWIATFVMDGVQEVCADADVLPCVFDAAVFSNMIRQTPADLALIGRRFPKATAPYVRKDCNQGMRWKHTFCDSKNSLVCLHCRKNR